MATRKTAAFIALSLLATGCRATADTGTQGCTAGAGQQAYTHPQAGYCLVVPASYQVVEYESGEVMIGPSVQAGMEPGLPFLAIEPVESAEGKTAAEAADDFVAFMLGGLEGFEITQTETTLGSAPAVQIDGLPGQDSNRQLIAVQDDVIYRLWIVPATEDYGDAYTEAMSLYALATESFVFGGAGD